MFSWDLLDSWKVTYPTLEVGPTLEIHVPQENAGAEEIKGRRLEVLDSGPMGEVVRDLTYKGGVKKTKWLKCEWEQIDKEQNMC